MVQLQVVGIEDLPGLLGRAAGRGWQAPSSPVPVLRGTYDRKREQEKRAGKERHCHVHHACHAVDFRVPFCRTFPPLSSQEHGTALGKGQQLKKL